MRDLYLPVMVEGCHILAGGLLVATVRKSKLDGQHCYAGFDGPRMLEPTARPTQDAAILATLGWLGAISLIDDVPPDPMPPPVVG